MKIGPYTFTNVKRFPGRDGYGLSFSVFENGKRIAEYFYAGDGGEGEIHPVSSGQDKAFIKDTLRRFITFATEHAPSYPGSEEYGLPEHPGDLDFFAAAVEAWSNFEKESIRYNHRNMTDVLVLLDNQFPVAYTPYSEAGGLALLSMIDYVSNNKLRKPALYEMKTGKVEFAKDFPVGDSPSYLTNTKISLVKTDSIGEKN